MKKILVADQEKCTGCHSCEVWCSFFHFKDCNPFRARLHIVAHEDNGEFEPNLCHHCRDAWCANECPTNAILRDPESDAVVINDSLCIDCLACVDACPFGAIKRKKNDKVYKCNLCQGNPVCVQSCTRGAILYTEATKAYLDNLTEQVDKKGRDCMTHGWAGNILRIDLTRQVIKMEPLPKSWRTQFIGANGINDWILWNEVSPETDPLSPDNRLIFGVGPLAGTLIPLGSRTHVTTRSPLTGIFGDANSGGFWSSMLKYAGYDHVVISGKTETLNYIFINDDEVVIRDASHLQGLDVYQTVDVLKKELGNDVAVAAIGQAGENQVRFAGIMFDRYRAAAKAGAGCVMGSKNLKAIAVRGSKPITVARPEEVWTLAEDIRRRLDINQSRGIASFAKYGTTFLASMYNELGCNSVRNYQETVFTGPGEINPDNFVNNYVKHNVSCSVNCPVHCAHRWKIPEGRYAGEEGSKLEYIVMDALGMHLGVGNIRAVLHFQNMVNRHGLDATQTGTCIGLLMELWQRGIISGKDTDGLEFDWGNLDTIEETINLIASRKGVGELLAEGTLAAAKKINPEAEKYVCHSKGLTEVEDVRGFPGWALGYAISTRGADHLKAHCQIDKQQRHDVSERLFGVPDVGIPTSISHKGKSAKYHEEFQAIINSTGVCMMNALSLSIKFKPEEAVHMADYASILTKVTGIDFTDEDIQKCGERIVCLEKSFNARLGLSRKDDTLHGRWMDEPCPSGIGKGMKCEDYLEECLDEYYTERGFDKESGLPTVKKLEELGLGTVAQELVNRIKTG